MDDFKKFLKENNYEGDLEFQLCDLGLAFDEGKKLKWKPSDEQMEALKSSTYCQNKQMSKVLFELYQDLKKLKEE